MKVLLFGATGMVGSGVLIECLTDERVESVLSVGRSTANVNHPKLREIIRSDFFEFSDAKEQLTGYDACFFCLGVSSVGMDEAKYQRLTYDLTIAAAATLAEVNPGMTFCYVSGAGTDSTEQGRSMWARVKGKTENRLLEMPFDAYMFRPGYIQPLKGARSKTKLYQAVYNVAGWLFPLFDRLIPNKVTTTVSIGRAMIEVAANGYEKPILDTPDINRLAAANTLKS